MMYNGNGCYAFIMCGWRNEWKKNEISWEKMERVRSTREKLIRILSSPYLNNTHRANCEFLFVCYYANRQKMHKVICHPSIRHTNDETSQGERGQESALNGFSMNSIWYSFMCSKRAHCNGEQNSAKPIFKIDVEYDLKWRQRRHMRITFTMIITFKSYVFPLRFWLTQRAQYNDSI